MRGPQHISINDYSYTLPEEKIAHHPLPNRDDSKLLVYKAGLIVEKKFTAIADELPANSLLIFNNTRVIAARLLFQKQTGGIIEIFCLEPDERYKDISTAMATTSGVYWKCLVGGASKWKSGQVLEKNFSLNNENVVLKARFAEKKSTHFIIELSWLPASLTFAELLHYAGAIPLPPYIKRAAEAEDTKRYQTVYAAHEGSVAAPTAGLHFTPTIFEQLEAKNIAASFVTLHVGAGTFKPVKSETLLDHDMHAEWIDVNKETITALITNVDNTVVTIGTTSLRTIESLYWLGVKIHLAQEPVTTVPKLLQWEAYELSGENVPVQSALQSLLDFMEHNQLDSFITTTQILIAPGYEFRLVKALITNFHQPQSTLLLLVAALIGEDWRKVYDYALQNEFRFLSYGDGSLLWKGHR